VDGSGPKRVQTYGMSCNSIRRASPGCPPVVPVVRASTRRQRQAANDQQLDLSDNPLNPTGATALMEDSWRDLTDLDLSGTAARDAGVQAVARSPALQQLVSLSLAPCRLTQAGLESLLRGLQGNRPESGAVVGGRLVLLDLSANAELGDEAIQLLAESKLRRLRFLFLNGLDITPGGVDSLLHSQLADALVRWNTLGVEPLLKQVSRSAA
jgi:Ran GTPase-activating protein (RanGAP) involved in mRNA processing and transport